MDINNLQRTPSYSYQVDTDRIKQRLQQNDKSSSANQRQGDSVDISEKGRNALQEKVSAMKRLGQIKDTKNLSSINSGSYGIMNDFERIMSELGGGSVSDDLVTKEKELEMLDNAYETHSRFMATSTQIWSELQDFKVQTVYHSSGAKTETSSTKEQNIGVKEQAYNGFMSAISTENSRQRNKFPVASGVGVNIKNKE